MPRQNALSRRTLLSGGASFLIGPAGAKVPLARAEDTRGEPSLRIRAAAGSMLYGSAVSTPDLESDTEFAKAIIRECGIVVPEWELKRGMIQKVKNRLDWSGGDRLQFFAAKHAIKMRGHTLVWYYGNPPWLEEELQQAPRESLLTDLISAACCRYRGSMHSWDVVNELVEIRQGHQDGLRTQSPWYQAFGESYIATAFHAARAADPHALLFYGDYNVEGDSTHDNARRHAVIRLLEKLKAQNVPIDGFGIQGHLRAYQTAFDEHVFDRFLAKLSGMGLKIMVTELDVSDRGGSLDPRQRDADVASLTRRLVDVAMANPAMLGVMTWGLSDRYSWLSRYPEYRWPDGQLSRGLPLDGDLQRKPMWAALAAALGKPRR